MLAVPFIGLGLLLMDRAPVAGKLLWFGGFVVAGGCVLAVWIMNLAGKDKEGPD
jgi:hypothetical protein